MGQILCMRSYPPVGSSGGLGGRASPQMWSSMPVQPCTPDSATEQGGYVTQTPGLSRGSEIWQQKSSGNANCHSSRSNSCCYHSHQFSLPAGQGALWAEWHDSTGVEQHWIKNKLLSTALSVYELTLSTSNTYMKKEETYKISLVIFSWFVVHDSIIVYCKTS